MAATRIAIPRLEEDLHQKRTKSSAIRSFMHKRTLSKGVALSSAAGTATESHNMSPISRNNEFIPSSLEPTSDANDVLAELHLNHQSPPHLSPRKSRDERRPIAGETIEKPSHKKTLSTISLRSLGNRGMEKVAPKDDKPSKPKKTKSSTNIAALLSRPKSARNLRKQAEEQDIMDAKNKENQEPQASQSSISRPPIYAQFSSQHFAIQPLGGKFLENEIPLFTTGHNSSLNQKNKEDVHGTKTTLDPQGDAQRPGSTYLPSSFSLQDIHREADGISRHSVDEYRTTFTAHHSTIGKMFASVETKGKNMTMARQRTKVMDAMNNFTLRTKVAEAKAEPIIDIKNVDAEFEAMLDRRNIPENQRHKMRSLATSMKMDFIKQDWAETSAGRNENPGTHDSTKGESKEVNPAHGSDGMTKRPRSRTFTLSRSSKETTSPTKKARPESGIGGHYRSKSSDSTNSRTKSLTSSGAAAASTLISKAKGQLPDDFAVYLREVQKPELVEVGKLHKLRLLLRNETVAWTDAFIDLGGMAEIVGLLQRTMEVEWREEHEDALLHEVLLCLKALCTTALALRHLNNIQSTLFPALINMLFDEERKGPSEFTTRNVITSLLFTYLKSAPLCERSIRAKTLLSYLRDPERKEEEQPVGFVLEMHRDRPYRVWCKEVVNVTKEVFWIFMHNLNVIALPPTTSGSIDPPFICDNSAKCSASSSSRQVTPCPKHSYMVKHFPQEPPPVAAAPYVGGVEWDATNYLASHLDLVNGIISSLPTLTDRCVLRDELRVSGWERCMGGKMRQCKEKFYGGVHVGLRCWIAAALDDGWEISDVRCGPPVAARSPVRRSPAKKNSEEEAPRIEIPKLDFIFDKQGTKNEDVWL